MKHIVKGYNFSKKNHRQTKGFTFFCSRFSRRNYVLLSDLLDQLRMSRALLLKRCRRLDIREMPWSKFLAEIADRSLAAVPKFSPPDSSTQEGVAELVPLNYSVRRLLNIRVECVSLR